MWFPAENFEIFLACQDKGKKYKFFYHIAFYGIFF